MLVLKNIDKKFVNRKKVSIFANSKQEGEMPERLKEQFAKLSSGDRCVGSNPILSSFLEKIWQKLLN